LRARQNLSRRRLCAQGRRELTAIFETEPQRVIVILPITFWTTLHIKSSADFADYAEENLTRKRPGLEPDMKSDSVTFAEGDMFVNPGNYSFLPCQLFIKSA
jgi:hypothetical protein